MIGVWNMQNLALHATDGLNSKSHLHLEEIIVSSYNLGKYQVRSKDAFLLQQPIEDLLSKTTLCLRQWQETVKKVIKTKSIENNHHRIQQQITHFFDHV